MLLRLKIKEAEYLVYSDKRDKLDIEKSVHGNDQQQSAKEEYVTAGMDMKINKSIF